MTRVEFTEMICRLILKMRSEGEDPILDYVKQSGRQRGRAGDIYFLDLHNKGKLAAPIKGHAYWHKVWEEMGGKPTIMWDKGHFEG